MARLLLLLALLPFLSPRPALARQAADPGEPRVACAACDGTGSVETTCFLCAGEGEHGCLGCRGRAVRSPSPRWSLGWRPAALGGRPLPDVDMSALKKILDMPLPGLPAGQPKRAKLKPGEIRCPAGCTGGEHALIDEWVDCKLCRSGKHRCAVCRGGKVRCAGCNGRRRRTGACSDCAGNGWLPDPAGAPASVCPWCLGAAGRPCGTCDAEGRVTLPCGTCAGQERVACPECKGVSKLACGTCRGRGRTGQQKARCDACDGKGVRRCVTCDGGVRACPTCAGGAPPASACPDCAGQKLHPCNGCGFGAYLSWEVSAERALAGGDAARALAWLEVARRRSEDRYVAPLRGLAEVEDAKERASLTRAVEREREDELERLDDLLDAARKAAEGAR
jgi:hypothetical protein